MFEVSELISCEPLFGSVDVLREVLLLEGTTPHATIEVSHHQSMIDYLTALLLLNTAKNRPGLGAVELNANGKQVNHLPCCVVF